MTTGAADKDGLYPRRTSAAVGQPTAPPLPLLMLMLLLLLLDYLALYDCRCIRM